MGRFATDIAAAAVNANNLPARDQLPDISLWDALLPRKCASPKNSKEKRVSIMEVSRVSLLQHQVRFV